MPRSLAIAALALAGCAVGPAPAEFRERLLAVIPEGVTVSVPIAFSPDGTRAAYVARRGDEHRAVLGEWSGKPYGVI